MKTLQARIWFSIAMSAAIIAAFANDSNHERDQVSPQIIAMLKRHFPDCEITDVDDSKKEGEKILRIRLEDPDEKQNILAKVSTNGELLELDEDIEIQQLPGHVERAFRKAFPHAKVDHVEKGTKIEISYRLDISQNGRKHEVRITRRGRIFEVVDRD